MWYNQHSKTLQKKVEFNYTFIAIPASNDNYPPDFLDDEFWENDLP